MSTRNIDKEESHLPSTEDVRGILAPPATPAVSREDRKIVQVAITGHCAFALAADGTLWWQKFSTETWNWKPVPPLPLTAPLAPPTTEETA